MKIQKLNETTEVVMRSIVIDPNRVRASRSKLAVGDVGVTYTRTAGCVGGNLATVECNLTNVSDAGKYIDGLADDAAGRSPRRVVYGAAGPVNDNAAQFTNLDGFVLYGSDLERAMVDRGRPVPVTVVNDALCGGAGVIMLDPDELVQLNGATSPLLSHDLILVVMLGTGQGMSMIIDGRRVQGFELGHLWARRGSNPDVDTWMAERFNNAVVSEHLVSGMGLELIARALIDYDWAGSVDAELALAHIASHDRAKYIAQQGKRTDSKANPVFQEALRYLREHLGYLVSALSTTCGAVVLAGSPVVNDFDYLFGDPAAASGCWALKPHILARSEVVEVANQVPLYVARPKMPINLSGAGAIGATLEAA
jgi:glucokinase